MDDMRYESAPYPEQMRFFRTLSAEYRTDFQRGLLQELQPYPSFVVWRYNKDFKKPPYSPRSHYPASVSDPSTWGTLNQALGALGSGYFHGIGFVLSKDDPFTGIDLDHCRLRNGYIEPWAREIIERINTYTEISPSEHGIRMFVSGKANGGKNGTIEMYSELHYMTITTRSLTDPPKHVEARPDSLQWLEKRFFNQRRENTGVRSVSMNVPGGSNVSNSPPLNGHGLPLAAQADTQLLALLDGDTSYQQGDQSRADYSALRRLLDYTGNREWTKQIFLSYPIGQRDKVKEQRRGVSYLDYTLDRIQRKR